jgi:hypothetical protein
MPKFGYLPRGNYLERPKSAERGGRGEGASWSKRLLVQAMRLTPIKADMIRPGNHLAGTDQGILAMNSDMIEIWAGILGLAYLAAASLCLELFHALKHVPVSHGQARLSQVKASRPR